LANIHLLCIAELQFSNKRALASGSWQFAAAIEQPVASSQQLNIETFIKKH
jgi:hypothetical protein